MADTREFTSNDVFRTMYAIVYNEKNVLYWVARVKDRLEYLKPLVDECELKGFNLKEISKSLYNEYEQLLEITKKIQKDGLDKKLQTQMG